MRIVSDLPLTVAVAVLIMAAPLPLLDVVGVLAGVAVAPVVEPEP